MKSNQCLIFCFSIDPIWRKPAVYVEYFFLALSFCDTAKFYHFEPKFLLHTAYSRKQNTETRTQLFLLSIFLHHVFLISLALGPN